MSCRFSTHLRLSVSPPNSALAWTCSADRSHHIASQGGGMEPPDAPELDGLHRRTLGGAPVSGIYASGLELLTSIEERPEQLPKAAPVAFLEQGAHARRAEGGHPCHWCR